VAWGLVGGAMGRAAGIAPCSSCLLYMRRRTEREEEEKEEREKKKKRKEKKRKERKNMEIFSNLKISEK
jgi:hypothetical protein